MRLSIVIPVYNTEPYLEKCLGSCLKQDIDISDYEIVIVNDGTKDNAMSVAERFGDEYPNVRIISQENAGLSVARNVGLSHSEGDYVWFVDSDDYISQNSLGLVFEKISENPDVICVQCQDNMDESPRNVLPREARTGFDVIVAESWQHCAPFAIFKRKFLNDNNLRFLAGIFHEDAEFVPRAMALAKNVEVIDKPLYNYVIRTNDSIMTSKNAKKSYDNITVAESLVSFLKGFDFPKDVVTAFNRLISVAINNAFANISGFDKKSRTEFGKYIGGRKYIFDSLKMSGVMKYRVEYHLFKIFRKYTEVYNALQKLNKKA